MYNKFSFCDGFCSAINRFNPIDQDSSTKGLKDYLPSWHSKLDSKWRTKFRPTGRAAKDRRSIYGRAPGTRLGQVFDGLILMASKYQNKKGSGS